MSKKFKVQLVEEPNNNKQRYAYLNFLTSILPVQSGAVHWTLPAECLSDTIREKLKIDRSVWMVDVFKTEKYVRK